MDGLPVSSKDMPYSGLRAAANDGRATNVFFRQTQIRRLSNELLAEKTTLMRAIADDSGNTPTEAWVEFYLTLSALKHYFAGLSPEKELHDEYRVANCQDAADAREAVGIVYIEPGAHSYLYSVIVPIGGAVAAGNCVLVVIERTLKTLPALLQKILQRCLDPDTLEITPSKVENKAFLNLCAQVVQTGVPDAPTPTTLYSNSDALAVGVVDRTADVGKTAKALVAARFSFGGTSSYAPDVVLVNEHMKTAFLNEAARHSIQYLTQEKKSLSELARKFDKKSGSPSRESDGVQIITSGTNGEVLFVKDRAMLMKLKKIRRKALYVHSVTSMDDAINLTNSLSNNTSTALAAYVFGAPSNCKYLSQFILSQVAFANHVPLDMLVGPPAPLNVPMTPFTRYPVSAFTILRPVFYNKSRVAQESESFLSEDNPHVLAQKQLKFTGKLELPSERPVKHMIGFFEQGILVGLATAATPILLTLGTVGYIGVSRFLLPRIRN
ncbi:hypothetical protein SCUCBS95973_008972 [Sporothrix curviconia]|uniref:Aldehyde dehydrogenase domain-containing protein n=1 Tax=Sporothrix curviconia TaxID=1260050 RepID=A0ABP0CU93_9PEZI